MEEVGLQQPENSPRGAFPVQSSCPKVNLDYAKPPAVPSPARRIATHSWALQRYVARSFLQLLGLSFAVLLAAYLVVDVLERLQWFARFNATAYEAVRFYGLRIPLLVSRIVPMALLVATALLVSLMGVRGENGL